MNPCVWSGLLGSACLRDRAVPPARRSAAEPGGRQVHIVLARVGIGSWRSSQRNDGSRSRSRGRLDRALEPSSTYPMTQGAVARHAASRDGVKLPTIARFGELQGGFPSRWTRPESGYPLPSRRAFAAINSLVDQELGE